MKVKIQQSGGFAGINPTFEFDSATLADNAEALGQFDALVKAALPLPNAHKGEGADLIQYDIEIDCNKTSLDDTTMTDALRALYDFVKKQVLALKKKNK